MVKPQHGLRAFRWLIIPKASDNLGRALTRDLSVRRLWRQRSPESNARTVLDNTRISSRKRFHRSRVENERYLAWLVEATDGRKYRYCANTFTKFIMKKTKDRHKTKRTERTKVSNLRKKLDPEYLQSYELCEKSFGRQNGCGRLWALYAFPTWLPVNFGSFRNQAKQLSGDFSVV